MTDCSFFLSLCRAAATTTFLPSTTCCWSGSGSIEHSSSAVSVGPGTRDPAAPPTPPRQRSAHKHILKAQTSSDPTLTLKSKVRDSLCLFLGDHGVQREL